MAAHTDTDKIPKAKSTSGMSKAMRVKFTRTLKMANYFKEIPTALAL
ncbi:hypothetical protein [uncultured Campylobacter sp.]|nr:hypothetical protein [uncultured Campylobacter sp.]